MHVIEGSKSGGILNIVQVFMNQKQLSTMDLRDMWVMKYLYRRIDWLFAQHIVLITSQAAKNMQTF